MKTKLQNIFIVSLVVSFSSVSLAKTVPYGMGGCGLGALVIKKNGMGSQLGAALLNNLVFPATFAITSGTSNCTEDLSQISSIEKEVYISANYENIAKEAAQGTGEHLTTLASLMGCSNGSDFAQFSQEHYDALFTDSDSQKLLNRYQSEARSSSKLAENCSIQG